MFMVSQIPSFAMRGWGVLETMRECGGGVLWLVSVARPVSAAAPVDGRHAATGLMSTRERTAQLSDKNTVQLQTKNY